MFLYKLQDMALWTTCWMLKTSVWRIISPVKFLDWNLYVVLQISFTLCQHLYSVDLLISVICGLCFLQLAYDIDKDAEDQNTYLDGMVGILQMFTILLPCWHMGCGFILSLVTSPFNLCIYSGLQLPQCNWLVDWKREEVFHDGAIWPRQ